MDGVEIHFRGVALLRRAPSHRRGNLIAQGLAWDDGEQVVLRTDDEADKFICVIPDDLIAQALPLTGRLANWYPRSDFYIVCGDRINVAQQAI